jgi:hypothetical protein
MKTIFKAALILGAINFAIFANAQTVSTNPVTTTGTPETVNNQADFVTVGAIMPYATPTVGNASDWVTAMTNAGISTTDITTTTTWNLFTLPGTTATPLTVADPANFRMAWTTEGQYRLEATTVTKLNSTVLCEGTTPAEKLVFVLPKPTVAFGTLPAQIQACTETDLNVPVTLKGIGSVKVNYTVTVYDPSATTGSVVSVTNGASAAAVSVFEGTYASALDIYNGAGTTVDIPVSSLIPGYAYVVTLTGVEDQISRKSGVNVDLTANNTFAFTVAPTPANTTIQHVKNVE